MNKTVYVNAYTRSDGTHVKEHYRNITGLLPESSTEGTIEEFPQTPYDDMVIWNLDEPLVLEGGVSTDVYLPDDIIIIDSNDSGVNTSATVAQSPANMSFKALELAVQLSEAVRNSDINVIANLKTQLDSTIGNIKQIQVQSQKLSQKYLEKLVNTKDKTEYKNLLKSFTKQKEINTRARQQIKRIEYAAQNNDYENLINELKNYQSNFDDIIKKNQSKRPLNIGKLAPINIYNSTPVSSPYMNNYVPENELSPLVSKKIIDTSTLLGHASNILHNSYEFWKASSYNFTRSKDYIEKNGNLIHSVSELPTKELHKLFQINLNNKSEKKIQLV